jgi:phage tail-like protein
VASRKPEPLLRINCFAVFIGDQEFGFAEVGRLTSETELPAVGQTGLAPVRDAVGQTGSTPVRDRSDKPGHRFATVILRRALTTSTELYDWRRLIVSGKDDRRDVTIRQLSAPGGKPVNAWTLKRAWPIRWSGPAFDAMKSDVACEELELTFEDLLWLGADKMKG